MNVRTMFVMPIVLLSIALACSSSVNPPEGIGEARMEVTQVPPGVGCIRVVAAATRTVQLDFNVSPGTSSILDLNGIPTGRVDFSANAFPMQCPPAPGAVPTWLSDTVTATVGAGMIAQVTLSMHPNGRAQVGVDFGTPPPCAPLGASCQNSSACCSTVCVSDPSGNGTCAPANGGACVAPTVPCPSMGMGGVTCADLTSDGANCGMCGHACPSGASCVMGTCTGGGGCMPPQVSCGGTCVDVTSNPGNCGACGINCGSAGVCQNGACVTCGAPSFVCPDAMGVSHCIDPTSDSQNCGGCGIACSPNTGCVNGSCLPISPGSCPAPFLLCNSAIGPVCSDRFADANNCGGCGFRCATGSACVNGMCDGPCAPARQMCMGPTGVVCSNRSTDATNCGACGMICPAGRACISGICR